MQSTLFQTLNCLWTVVGFSIVACSLHESVRFSGTPSRTQV